MTNLGCTIVGYYDLNDSNYFLASNSDNPWDALTVVTVQNGKNFKFIGTKLICEDERLPWSNMITRGVSEAGIGYTFSYVDYKSKDNRRENIIFKGFGEHILGSFSSLNQIHDYIKDSEKLPHGNFIFSDSEGNFLACELNPDEQKFVWNPKGTYLRTNHYLILDNQEQKYVEESNSMLRYEHGLEKFKNINSKNKAPKKVLKDFLKNHMGYKESGSWGNTTCNHGSEVGTVSSEIIDTKQKTLWYRYGPPCGNSDHLTCWEDYREFRLSDFSGDQDLTTIKGEFVSKNK